MDGAQPLKLAREALQQGDDSLLRSCGPTLATRPPDSGSRPPSSTMPYVVTWETCLSGTLTS